MAVWVVVSVAALAAAPALLSVASALAMPAVAVVTAGMGMEVVGVEWASLGVGRVLAGVERVVVGVDRAVAWVWGAVAVTSALAVAPVAGAAQGGQVAAEGAVLGLEESASGRGRPAAVAVWMVAPVPAVSAVSAEGFRQLRELLRSSSPGWACPGIRHVGAGGGPGVPCAPSIRQCPLRVPHSARRVW